MVEKFLNHELSESELKDFNEALKTDAELKQELDDQNMIHELVFSSEMKVLQNQVSSDVNSYFKSSNRLKWTIFGIVILSIVSVSAVYLNYSNYVAENFVEKRKIKSIPINVYTKPVEKDQKTFEVNDKKPKVIEENISSEDQELILKNSDYPIKENFNNTNLDSRKIQIDRLDENKQSIKNINENQTFNSTEILNKCLTENINLALHVTHATDGASNGEIEVKNFNRTSIDLPVKFRLKEISNDFILENTFTNLSPGSYHLELKDAKNCIISNNETVIVKSNPCNSQTEYLLNPSYENSVEIVLRSNTKKIEIRDPSGNLVREFDEELKNFFSWDGKNYNGELLSKGLYLYKTYNIDGSNCLGSITILN